MSIYITHERYNSIEIDANLEKNKKYPFLKKLLQDCALFLDITKIKYYVDIADPELFYDADCYKSFFIELLQLTNYSILDSEGFKNSSVKNVEYSYYNIEEDQNDSLLSEFIKLDNSDFQVSNVNIINDNQTLCFCINDKYYEYNLTQKSEWFDFKFIEKINIALAENKVGKLFCEFAPNPFSDEGGFIFIYTNYEIARELGKSVQWGGGGHREPSISSRTDNKLLLNGELFGLSDL